MLYGSKFSAIHLEESIPLNVLLYIDSIYPRQSIDVALTILKSREFSEFKEANKPFPIEEKKKISVLAEKLDIFVSKVLKKNTKAGVTSRKGRNYKKEHKK